MRRLIWLIPALILAACANPKYQPPAAENSVQAAFRSQAEVSLAWEQLPTETETGTFRFLTYRRNPLDGSKVLMDLGTTVRVRLWMPGMGHGSSPVTVERVGPGEYRASEVFFLMRGEWEIHIQIDSEGATDEAVLPFIF
jgi:hypothetical protein